jgi:S-adenosylmethionine:tRNA ribosyltransferase-isomerase
MKVDDFDFDQPKDLIAQRPASPRDSARLLRVTAAAKFTDHEILDLPGLLKAGDILVFNDTLVIPARLKGRRESSRGAAMGAAKVEVTLTREIESGRWLAFAKPAKKLGPGDRIEFAPDFNATVIARNGGEVSLDFGLEKDKFAALLAAHGEMPLPPYIKRTGQTDTTDASDFHDYQTIFARRAGAVAAPTAGLHFTERLMKALKEAGIGHAFLTLHVGVGTFLPVTVEDTRDHVMHAEWGEVGDAAARAINEARAAGGRIVAVGSTSLRLLETAADKGGRIRPFSGEADIFITPGYDFKTADLMLTNFHLPRSTLFMLVAAFAGLDRMRRAYAHAMENGYRFYSYGDACLIERARE